MNGTRLYVADTAFLNDKTRFQAAYLTVDPTRQQKIDRLRKDSDKRLSLAVFLLLREALAANGIYDFRLLYAENGKPYLEGSPLHISLSHSGEMVLCAVSEREVGCDIERIGTPRLAAAKRFFHPLEYKALADCASEEEERRLFYRLWTLKESVIKKTGRGLSQGLSSFAVQTDGKDVRLSDASASVYLRSYPLEGYEAAVCAETPPPDELLRLSLDKEAGCV